MIRRRHVVADLVGERVGAVEVRVGRVGHRSVGVDRNAAVQRIVRDLGRLDRVFRIRIGVVAQHVDRHIGVFIGARTVVARLRRAVDVSDGDVKCLGVRAAVAVVAGVFHVAEASLGVGVRDDVEARRVGQRARAVAVVGEARAARKIGRRDRRRVAVDVGTAHVDRERLILRDRLIGDAGGLGIVVDRIDRDRHGRLVAALDRRRRAVVADGVGERIDPVEVGIRRVIHCAVGVDRHLPVARRGLDLNSARVDVAIDVGVAVENVHGEGRVFVGRGGIVVGHRRVVDRDDLKRHGCRVALVVRVADRVLERVRPRKVRRWRVGDGAAVIDRRRAALRRARRTCNRQVIAVDVAVVVQHLDHRVGVLVGDRVGVVLGHGRVVDRGDRDSHLADVRAALAVVDFKLKGIRAVEIGIRDVLGAAVVVDDHLAARGRGHEPTRQRVPVRVVAVQGEWQRGVLGNLVLLVDGGRRGVVHQHRHRHAQRPAAAVLNQDFKTLQAAEPRGRMIHQVGRLAAQPPHAQWVRGHLVAERVPVRVEGRDEYLGASARLDGDELVPGDRRPVASRTARGQLLLERRVRQRRFRFERLGTIGRERVEARRGIGIHVQQAGEVILAFPKGELATSIPAEPALAHRDERVGIHGAGAERDAHPHLPRGWPRWHVHDANQAFEAGCQLERRCVQGHVLYGPLGDVIALAAEGSPRAGGGVLPAAVVVPVEQGVQIVRRRRHVLRHGDPDVQVVQTAGRQAAQAGETRIVPHGLERKRIVLILVHQLGVGFERKPAAEEGAPAGVPMPNEPGLPVTFVQRRREKRFYFDPAAVGGVPVVRQVALPLCRSRKRHRHQRHQCHAKPTIHPYPLYNRHRCGPLSAVI